MSQHTPPPLPQPKDAAIPPKSAPSEVPQYATDELKASYLRHLPQAMAELTSQREVLDFMMALISREVPNAIEFILENWPQTADSTKKALWQKALIEAVKDRINPTQDPERAANIMTAMYEKWREANQNPERFFDALLEKMRRNSWKTIRRTALVRMAVRDMTNPRGKRRDL